MMRRALLFLLLMAVATPGLFAAAKPWRFESGKKAEAERTYGQHTWNRHYNKALQLLDGGKSADLDEVIAILKLAIDMKGRSELGVVVKRMPLDYFPYYLLAEAYARRGDARSAQECLEKESPGLVRQSPTLGAKYTALASSITALVSKDEVLAQARSVLGWRGTDTAVVLGADYQQGIAGIEGMIGNVEKAGPQELRARLDALNSSLLDLCRKSVTARAGLIDELSKAPWGVSGLAGACAPAGGQASVAGVAAAITAVEGCVQAVATGVRTAGQKACGEIDSLRSEVGQLGEWNRDWHRRAKQAASDPDPLPDAPGVCAGWRDAPLATIIDSFDGLKESRANIVAALDAQRSTLNGSIAARRSELEGRLARARQQVPSISTQCATDLPIGRARSALNNLRTTLDPGRIPDRGVPTQEVFDAPDQVLQTLASLRTGLESAVQSLVQEGDLPDMDRTSFDRLSGLLESCLSQGDACQVSPICETARTAKAALGRYYRENEAALRAVLDDYSERLMALGPREAELECLSGARNEVDRLLSAQRGNAASWSEQASAARNDASSCIMTFRERTDAARAELLPQIEDAREMLISLESVCGGPQGMAQLKALCEQIASLDTELGRNTKAFDDVAALFQGEQPEA
jgi:tetratricopeptide (TPR) repeat protein